MADALKCFGFLSENVPTWIKTLDSLEQKVRDRQNEIARVPVPAHKLKKTGSNESIRPGAGSEDAMIEITSAPQTGDVAQAPHNHQQLLAKRKRKTTSLLSNGSGPNKYRTRSMIVVYYDSEIQESFETMVRNIASGRNLIRKARMASRMEALTAGSAAALKIGSRNGYAPSMAMFRSARGPGLRADPLADTGSSPNDAFGAVDAALDKAQSLCERGAHQFLRDGDCEAETSGAKNSFEEVAKLSKKEITRLKEEEEQRRQEKEEIDKRPASAGSEILNEGPLNEGPLIEVDDGDIDDLDVSNLDFKRTRLMA